MSGHQDHDQLHDHAAHQRLDSLELLLAELKDTWARLFLSGEVERMTFRGKEGLTTLTDDHGSTALSYAVYNPNDFRVFVGLAGTSASTDGLIVPKQKLVVAPLIINGAVQLAADTTELGEKSGTIIRVRFPTPQPFAAYALN
jgi:hypothetical protein